MKDIFGNKKPVQIEDGEYWFNGRIIQKQDHPLLSKYISFADDDTPFVKEHSSLKDAREYALENPFRHPNNYPVNYLS
jgi:hypothetical protein